MLFKKSLLILGLILCFSKITAQKFELGKVTMEELKEKAYSKDSSAVAAVLYNKGKTYFDYDQNDGFRVITEIEVKIKIYKKEGYEWANKEVPFYIGAIEKESVSFSKAITYNLVNGAIEKTKLKTEGEFTEVVNKYLAKKKITMPNVKEGSVIEYVYAIKSPFISSFPKWDFQALIPVNHSEYKTEIPEYFLYNVYRKGTIVPKETKSKLNKILNLFERQKTTRINTEVNYVLNQTQYLLENIPAIKEEAFVNNMTNYTPSIQHELSGKHMPDALYKSYSTTWDDVVKTIYDSSDFGNELKKSSYFEEDLKVILADQNTVEEKTNAIFNYVQTRMNWNEYTGYYCDGGVKKAYQEKTGNVAEINLMLVAMLRAAGIEANPVLLSTRNNGITIFPSRTAFNYVIAAVENQGNFTFLDATNKNTLPNILPLRALNWIGRIIRKDGTSLEVDLMPKSNSKEVVNVMASVDAQGTISGKVRDQYLDYNAFSFRDQYNTVSKDAYIEKLEKKYAGIEIGEYETLNKSDLSKPMIENYSFTHNNAAESIGNKMYLSPMLFFTETKNPFIQETREYPVDFVFPHQDKYLINLTIPKGYAVESLPAPINFGMSENLAGFKFNISNTENQIQLVVTFDINSAIVSTEYYEELKAFYSEIIKKENEKIVLIKK